MDRAANRSFSLSHPYQPQPQPQTPSNQLNTQNSTENSELSNSTNQSQPPRLTQALVSKNTVHGLADIFGSKYEQEDINIKEFSELKISSYSSRHSIQSPSTKPKLTKEIFSQICSAQSKSDLENCMRILGVSSLQELCEMKLEEETVLMEVARTGNAKLTSLLLQSVPDPQKLALMLSHDDNGFTGLMYAAVKSHVEVITAMLANVPNPQQLAERSNLRKHTAMKFAIDSRKAEAITALLNGVPNPQQLAEQDYACKNYSLRNAVNFRQVEIITALLAGVPNPQQLAEKKNERGETALHHAYGADHDEVAVTAALLSGVGNPQKLLEQKNDWGFTALMHAALRNRAGVITKMFEYIDDTEALIFQEDVHGNNAFMYALFRNETDAALLIFDKAKDKAALLLDKNGPDKKAAIQMMKPEILDLFIKKYNESKE